ncbi:hypothetical protein CDD80_1934 [Ophiocordyceps camponoti-rufipedis]|uniref:Gamma-glutamyltranspeptidase n=1 Tax=Ophiocordyceps camponoti-rufipedis TaxID=2004952 RepID=A0A2C5YCZ0_9HYPO|nr:hypothetical protein CDD80_1934 [Ophiocordyceps camponoti-rufipedis]
MPLPVSSIYPSDASRELYRFASRRSVVHSTGGIVACSQPLAAKCGLEVLRAGGNAAVSRLMTAGLNVTEPASTGIGGDMFILFWDAAAKKVHAINGSGRSGAGCTLDVIRKDLGIPDGVGGEIPSTSAHAVTVPGAAAGWIDTIDRLGSGKLKLDAILGPAIQLAEQGFSVHEEASIFWATAESQLRAASPNFAELLKQDDNAKDGVRAPQPGEVMRNPSLARTFRALVSQGKRGFYTGRLAEEIVAIVRNKGGLLSLDDLKHHLDIGSEDIEAVSIKFRGQGLDDKGIELWEHPPNGQGIVALMALGIIQQMQEQGKIPIFGPQDFNTVPYLHAIIEALRLAFSDAHWFVTDPDVVQVPVSSLLSDAYLAERARLFNPSCAAHHLCHGSPTSPALQSCDTVYFAVSDAQGNAASFINSNYAGFGTGIVPRGCGFALHNRGSNFSLDAGHPNQLAPRKRPYHTIIPAIVTSLADGSLHSVFGVMGGFMQPQGHVQVLLGQIVGRLNPQQALDALRSATIDGLRELGHRVKAAVEDKTRDMFGRGQIIRYTVDIDGTPICPQQSITFHPKDLGWTALAFYIVYAFRSLKIFHHEIHGISILGVQHPSQYKPGNPQNIDPVQRLRGLNERRIRQRYVLRDEDFEPNGPIIIQLTVQNADFESNHTICRHMTKRLKGKSVVLEHRFFGGSLPTVPHDPEHRVDEFQPATYKHLTLDNVMNDVRHLAKFLRRSGNQTGASPVVVVGVGYEGFVAAALRQRYPDEIFAAVAIDTPTMGLSLNSDYAVADQFYYRTAVSELYKVHSPLAVGRISRALSFLKGRIKLGDMPFFTRLLELCEEPLYDPSPWHALYNHYESLLLDAAVVQTRRGEFRSEWSTSDIAWLAAESARLMDREKFLFAIGQRTRIFAKMLRKMREGLFNCIKLTDFMLSPERHDEHSISQLWDPMSYVVCTYYPICTLNSVVDTIFGERNDGCKKAYHECQVKFNSTARTLQQREVWRRYDMSPEVLNKSSRILFSTDTSDPLSSLVAAHPPWMGDRDCSSSRRIEGNIAGQVTMMDRVEEKKKLREREVDVLYKWLVHCDPYVVTSIAEPE